MNATRSVIAVVVGLAACEPNGTGHRTFELHTPSGVDVRGDIVVAMIGYETFEPALLQVATLPDQQAPAPPASVFVETDAVRLGRTRMVAIDDTVFLGFGSHGALVGAGGAIDPASMIEIGDNAALVRAGERFAAVQRPEGGPLRVRFIERDGRAAELVDLAPNAVEELVPAAVGNATGIAVMFSRPEFGSKNIRIVRTSDTGAVLDQPEGIEIARSTSEDGFDIFGGVHAMAPDGSLVAIYTKRLYASNTDEIHVVRISPGASPSITDEVTKLVTPPTHLVASGDRLLAVTIDDASGHITARVLDTQGRPVPDQTDVDITTTVGGNVFATSTGFALLHGTPDVRFTPIGFDGRVGTTVEVAAAFEID